MPIADRLRAVDLLTGHDRPCRQGQCACFAGPTEGMHEHDCPAAQPCLCRLAERHQAARDIDAWVEALEGLLKRAKGKLRHAQDCDGGYTPCACGVNQLFDDINILLAEVSHAPRR